MVDSLRVELLHNVGWEKVEEMEEELSTWVGG